MKPNWRAFLATALLFGGGAIFAQTPVHMHMGAAVAPTLYAAPLSLTAANGRPFDVGSLKGSPVLATMFFATCPDVCPIMTEQLRQVWSHLPPVRRAKLRVLLVSFDPEDDRPPVLRAYAHGHNIDQPGWTVAVADPATSQQLGALLGVQFRRLGRADYSHVPMINLVAPSGVVLARLPSASLGTPLFSAAVAGLLAS